MKQSIFTAKRPMSGSPTKYTKTTARVRKTRTGRNPHPNPTNQDATAPQSSPREASENWSEALQSLYRVGAAVRDEVESAVLDASYSRPRGALLAFIRRISADERRRIVDDIGNELAKQQKTNKRFIVLSLKFYDAVESIIKVAGKKGKATIFSARSKLDVATIVRLSRKPPAKILQELDRLRCLATPGRKTIA